MSLSDTSLASTYLPLSYLPLSEAELRHHSSITSPNHGYDVREADKGCSNRDGKELLPLASSLDLKNYL